MTELIKIKLLVAPPAGNPVPQLRMSYEEFRRRSTRRTILVEPVGPHLFRVAEPSLICAFSYRDVIEATPINGGTWRFARVRAVTMSTNLLVARGSIIYSENQPTYRLIRTMYDMWRHCCPLRRFDDWVILGIPPDLPFDPMDRIRPPTPPPVTESC